MTARPPILRLHVEGLIVDSFAGGGGASLGIEMALGRSPDIAINHDPEALAMHAVNHPATRHFCESVWDVDPVEVCGGRPVALAWFSPDCTFHSKARGAKPFRDRDAAKRRRGLAWVVTRWARAVRPAVICLENVEEFQDWGPLTDDGKPDPERRGFTFRRWLAQLRNLGYQVELRELRACDYGAPTIRKRLFVVARCDGRAIEWPIPTHGPRLSQPWRVAADCIDWSISCPSIFDRRKPLAENTLRRIARGIRRYVIEAGQPFIVPVTHQGDARVHGMGDPLPTVTAANRGELSLVTPFLAEYHSPRREGDDRAKPLDVPLPVQDTANRFGLVAPTLIQTGYGERPGQAPRSLDLRAPLGTVVGGGAKHAVVSAFLARHYGGHENDGAPLQAPMFTVTCTDHHSLVTVAAQPGSAGRADEVRAFLIKYYGADHDNPQLGLPLHTVTTKDRFGLVTVHGQDYVIADIGMRMLTPRELFRAQGFPDSYQIVPLVRGKPMTKTQQIEKCGNSVCPSVAAAIVAANLAEPAARELAATAT